MKILYKLLVYCSIIFLVIYLYKYDYFHIRGLHFRYHYLIAAVIFLWAGFLLSAVSWWNALKVHGIHVKVKLAIISHGLSIFTKYIPGKIWVILGRASFVSQSGSSMKAGSYISLKEQLIYIWVGLLIGIGPLLYYYPFNGFVILVLLITLFFTVFLYSKKFHKLLINILQRIIRKEIDVPLVSFREVLPVIVYILFYWSAWLVAFYFFLMSFDIEFGIGAVFCWPLSISLGVLALISPGGLGVREGIMTGFMVLTGIALETATTIAIISRLWFITGEVFIFFLSWSMNRFRLKYNE